MPKTTDGDKKSIEYYLFEKDFCLSQEGCLSCPYKDYFKCGLIFKNKIPSQWEIEDIYEIISNK